MISITRNFKLLIIDDNETDLKVIQRLVSKDYKNIDVVARNGVTDWKIFLEGNKFDLILLNYAAGSSVGLQEIKKILSVNDTIPIYIMIWQHEVEVGMKAIYQGAEGFVIKDKTYLNLKKVIQRALINYLIYSELSSLREINDIISEEINDGFFRFSKDGEVDYISDKFIKLLGFDAEFELSQIFKDLFNEIKDHVKNNENYDKKISFIFNCKGKDNSDFWFEVFFYKKIDLRNDSVYYEGVVKNVTEIKRKEETTKKLKTEIDVLFNYLPFPIEAYDFNWKRLYSNPQFTKLLNSISSTAKEYLTKTKEFQTVKENFSKIFQGKPVLLNIQKLTFEEKEKYYDLIFIPSELSPETFFLVYKDITDTIRLQKNITDSSIRRNAFYNAADVGFIELDTSYKIVDISEKAILILGKGIKNYNGSHISELFNEGDYDLLQNALNECKKIGKAAFYIEGNIKISLSIIGNTLSEIHGFIIALENISKLRETENSLKDNIERLNIINDSGKFFIWQGYIAGNVFKPNFVSKGIEKILGISVDEALELNSKVNEELFGCSSCKDFIKNAKDSNEKEINLKNNSGLVKQIKIKYDLQKEAKDYYKLCALFEDITDYSVSLDKIQNISKFFKNYFANDSSLLFKIDSNLLVKEVYYSGLKLFSNIEEGDYLPEQEIINQIPIIDYINKSLQDGSIVDTIINSLKDPARFYKLFLIPSENFYGQKILFVYIKDITEDRQKNNDYNYLTKFTDSLKEFDVSFLLVLEDKKIVFANSGFLALVGYKYEEIINKDIETFFTKESCEEITKLLKSSRKKVINKLSVKIIDKASSIKSCYLQVSIITQDNLPDKILLLGYDETEKIELKSKLDYIQQLSNIVSDSAQDGLIIWKNDSLVYCNNAFCNMFGYKPEEVESISPSELFAPLQDKKMLDSVLDVLSGKIDLSEKVLQQEIICKQKHGTEFPAELSIFYNKLFSENVLCLYIKDISEKKNLQKVILLGDIRYKGIIDSINEGIWLFDNDYKTVFISPMIIDKLKYSVEEIIERRIFYFIKDSKFEFDKRFFEETPNAKYINLNLSFITKDNQVFRSSVNIIPLKNEKEEFIGGIMAVNDISELMKLENEIVKLKDLNQSYQKKIKSLESDLNNSKKIIVDYKKEAENLILEIEEKINSSKSIVEELTSKNLYIERLNYIIHNKLKNKVLSLIGFVNFIESVWSDIDLEMQKSYLRIFVDNIQETKKVIEILSVFTKYETKKIKFNPKIINLSELLTFIADKNKEKFDAKQIVLEITLEPNIIITGDPKFISFSLEEVFASVLKYSNQNSKVKFNLNKSDDKVFISVEVFEIDAMRFKEANPNFDSINNIDEFNFGLYLSKGLIEQHNGAFDITLVDGKLLKLEIALQYNKKTIVVSSGEENQIILSNYFKKNNCNYEIFGCDNNNDVIKKLIDGKYKPTVIFITFTEPENKFYDFLDQFKKTIDLNSLPVIVMTSDDSIEQKKKLMDFGLSHLIQLPLSDNNINQLFNDLLYQVRTNNG